MMGWLNGKALLFFIAFMVFDDGALSLIRRKREEEDTSQGNYALPPTEEAHNPFSSGNNPIPFNPMTNGLPTFPYVHQFSQGLDVDPGDIFYLKGHLNVSVEGWGDMKGSLKGGPSHIWENYGHLLSPINTLGLPPAENFLGPQNIGESAQSGIHNAQRTEEGVRKDEPGQSGDRGQSDAVPVATLPTGWVPVKCRPPFCNPYVHTFDTGIQVEPGNDAWLDGSLDLPIKSKAGDHFPLDGSLYAGTMPVQVLYGHVLNPIDPRVAQTKEAARNPLNFRGLFSRLRQSGNEAREVQSLSPVFRSSPSENKENKGGDILVTPPPLDTTTLWSFPFPTPPSDEQTSASDNSNNIARDSVPKSTFVLPPALPQ